MLVQRMNIQILDVKNRPFAFPHTPKVHDRKVINFLVLAECLINTASLIKECNHDTDSLNN